MTFESDEKRLKKGTEILKKLNFLHKAEGSFSEDFRSHTCLLYTSPSPRD